MKEKKVLPVVHDEPLVSSTGKFYRLNRTERNMYSVETISVIDGIITSMETTEPAYLPIAFDILRRRTGEAFFAAVQEGIK